MSLSHASGVRIQDGCWWLDLLAAHHPRRRVVNDVEFPCTESVANRRIKHKHKNTHFYRHYVIYRISIGLRQ